MDCRSSLVSPPNDFGSYSLKGELGHGASGRVFECKKKDSNTPLAVKILNLRSLRLGATAQRDLTRLGRELKILKELPPHPRIVQLVDAFEEGDWFFLILELVRGGDLFRALMERRPARLLEREVAFVFWQLVDGLGFLHRQNIIHRDLKLENVLISDRHREGKLTLFNVKISDFGLSKAVADCAVETLNSVVGTQRYVAPEVLRRPVSYDYRVDFWSLGILTYLLLAGSYPNPQSQQSLDESIAKITSEPARQMLQGLLQLDPARRSTFQALQSQSWETGDEDVIMLPPASTASIPNGTGAPSPSTLCSSASELWVAPPAPLQSLCDSSIISDSEAQEPEPEPNQLTRLPSLNPTMSFLAGMEEELALFRSPRASPRAPKPTSSPVQSLRRMLSEEQLQNLTDLSDMEDPQVSKANIPGADLADLGVLGVERPEIPSGPLALSHVRAAAVGPSELHLHFMVPRSCAHVVSETTLKDLSAKSGCNVWTTPPDDALTVVIVGTCSQCATAQKMLADFLQRDAKEPPLNSFTVVLFLCTEVLPAPRKLLELQEQSRATLELLPNEQEGRRPCIITGTLEAVLEAQRLIDAAALEAPAKRRRVEGTTLLS